MISTTSLRPGMIVIHKGELYRVVSATHVAPGNWRAMMQTKLRNLKTGTQIEFRFSADEKVERAILEQHEMEFLYSDGDQHHFMNTENYEQVVFTAEVLGDTVKFLQPNCKVKVDMYEGSPVAVELPKAMAFKVIQADPSVRRATASAQFKNAKLENGLTIRVPSFIEAGDVVNVDTETGEYLERA